MGSNPTWTLWTKLVGPDAPKGDLFWHGMMSRDTKKRDQLCMYLHCISRPSTNTAPHHYGMRYNTTLPWCPAQSSAISVPNVLQLWFPWGIRVLRIGPFANRDMLACMRRTGLLRRKPTSLRWNVMVCSRKTTYRFDQIQALNPSSLTWRLPSFFISAMMKLKREREKVRK